MPISPETRHYQAAQMRRVVLIRGRTVVSVSRMFGRPGQTMMRLVHGHSVLTCYDVARLGHILDLSDKQVRRLVEGAALRDWSASDRGRPHPFTRGDP